MPYCKLIKREADIRLSCRWLDDLTKADEGMIQACDQAYDRAKHQSGRMGQMKGAPQSSKTVAGKEKNMQQAPNKEQEFMKPFIIKIDANQARLSHILLLKKLFTAHTGPTPIEIHFHNEEHPLAALHIDAKRGVTLSEQFKQELGRVASVLESS